MTRLYAVYRNSENVYSDATFPVGEYAILFLSEENLPGTILQVSEGQITRIDTLFDVSPQALSEKVNGDASELLLAPRQ